MAGDEEDLNGLPKKKFDKFTLHCPIKEKLKDL